jgi:hypothetical protein
MALGHLCAERFYAWHPHHTSRDRSRFLCMMLFINNTKNTFYEVTCAPIDVLPPISVTCSTCWPLNFNIVSRNYCYWRMDFWQLILYPLAVNIWLFVAFHCQWMCVLHWELVHLIIIIIIIAVVRVIFFTRGLW